MIRKTSTKCIEHDIFIKRDKDIKHLFECDYHDSCLYSKEYAVKYYSLNPDKVYVSEFERTGIIELTLIEYV